MRDRKCRNGILIALPLLILEVTLPASQSAARQSADGNKAVLWRDPADIASRDLFFGAGGSEGVPHGPFVFLDEDLSGTNPKFHVRDRDGVKWQVKLGIEARPETAASRLLWAVGYFTTEDYFLPELRVENMPAHLHRGRHLVAPDGTMHNARLKRAPGEKKTGSWRWCCNPFATTREYNGLRVMMALINNWDLKDENNSVYRVKGSPDAEELYLVSDLGASFGSTGRSWPAGKAKGNLESYRRSTFIRRATPDEIDFDTPTRPALFYLAILPSFLRRLGLRWIGKCIPRTDARWIGHLLAALSEDQIRDAFRAAGYSPTEVEGFTRVLRERIAGLNRL